MTEKIKIIWINIFIFLILALIIETAGQVIYYKQHYRFLFKGKHFNNIKLFEHHPFLGTRLKKNIVLREGEKEITTTDIHTRFTGAAANDENLIRVAVIGGSTTFGTLVTDKESWPAQLQRILGERYAVINYGTPGYSTAEGIIQTALIVPEKKPHVVIFYEGWNDIANYHNPEMTADYFAQGLKQSADNKLDDNRPLFQKLSEFSAIFYYANKFHDQVYKNKTVSAVTLETPDPFIDRIYQRNLRTLKVLTKEMGSDVLFVPQILNDSFYAGKEGSLRWSPRIKNAAMPTLLNRFNSLMNTLCGPDEEHCKVANEVLSEQWTPEDFADEGHFNAQGGGKFASIIAQEIKKIHP